MPRASCNGRWVPMQGVTVKRWTASSRAGASVLDADRLDLAFDSVLRQRASDYRQAVEQTVFPLSFRWFWLASSQDVAASYAWFQEWLSSYDELAAYKAACFAQDHALMH
jgi:hypothetical protein